MGKGPRISDTRGPSLPVRVVKSTLTTLLPNKPDCGVRGLTATTALHFTDIPKLCLLPALLAALLQQGAPPSRPRQPPTATAAASGMLQRKVFTQPGAFGATCCSRMLDIITALFSLPREWPPSVLAHLPGPLSCCTHAYSHTHRCTSEHPHNTGLPRPALCVKQATRPSSGRPPRRPTEILRPPK